MREATEADTKSEKGSRVKNSNSQGGEKPFKRRNSESVKKLLEKEEGVYAQDTWAENSPKRKNHQGVIEAGATGRNDAGKAIKKGYTLAFQPTLCPP